MQKILLLIGLSYAATIGILVITFFVVSDRLYYNSEFTKFQELHHGEPISPNNNLIKFSNYSWLIFLPFINILISTIILLVFTLPFIWEKIKISFFEILDN